MTTINSQQTTTKLADGRDIFYFDAPNSPVRVPRRDTRVAEPRPAAATMRFDPLLREWVTIAAARQSRPFLPTAADCPLCPSSEQSSTEIPELDYEVAVFENRFPSFGGIPAPDSVERPALGRCEVVCFTPDHDASFSSLSSERVALVVEAQTQRTAQLSQRDDIQQVFCFENRGIEIGVTLHHPHGQIYAYPYIAPTMQRMLNAVESHDGDLFGELLAVESSSDRVIAHNEHWVAFVPYSARWPFEVHFYPSRRVADLTELSIDERSSFASLYLRVLSAFERLFNVSMPYIFGWYQAPTHTGRGSWYLHARVFSIRRAADKLKYVAGSEAAMGAFINDLPPETSARILKELS